MTLAIVISDVLRIIADIKAIYYFDPCFDVIKKDTNVLVFEIVLICRSRRLMNNIIK